jgi:hypothetical protein
MKSVLIFQFAIGEHDDAIDLNRTALLTVGSFCRAWNLFAKHTANGF